MSQSSYGFPLVGSGGAAATITRVFSLRNRRVIYELKRGEIFEFVSPELPAGLQKVVSCWGVRYQQRPPLDPWHVVCKDAKGKVHCLVLPARTEVRRRPQGPSLF